MTGIPYNNELLLHSGIYYRVIFGCHHMYGVHHPVEAKAHKPLQITYWKALEDIAILSSCYSTKDKSLSSSSIKENYRGQILAIMPKVYEANFLSEELDKKVNEH